MVSTDACGCSKSTEAGRMTAGKATDKQRFLTGEGFDVMSHLSVVATASQACLVRRSIAAALGGQPSTGAASFSSAVRDERLHA